jgi:hypothetical protein
LPLPLECCFSSGVAIIKQAKVLITTLSDNNMAADSFSFLLPRGAQMSRVGLGFVILLYVAVTIHECCLLLLEDLIHESLELKLKG